MLTTSTKQHSLAICIVPYFKITKTFLANVPDLHLQLNQENWSDVQKDVSNEFVRDYMLMRNILQTLKWGKRA